MARPRKSLEHHLKNGTYRPDRHGPLPAPSGADDAPAGDIPRPSSLANRAAEVWADLVGLLRGVIRRRDVPALAELCRWIERSERIAAELDVLAPSSPKFKNLLIAAGIATDKVAALTRQFGLTPADRSRLKGVDTKPAKPAIRTAPRKFAGEDGQT